MDVDRVVRLSFTLRSTLSVDEREPCLRRVCMVFPMDMFGFQCYFNSKESIGDAIVSASIKSRSTFLTRKLQVPHSILHLHHPTKCCPLGNIYGRSQAWFEHHAFDGHLRCHNNFRSQRIPQRHPGIYHKAEAGPLWTTRAGRPGNNVM